MASRKWTRAELVQALSLFHQLPFGRMHQGNRAVIELADEIDRTPSAVALKLVNFASLDPELKARGVRGMPNVSQLDREIWNEFHGRWDALAEASIVDVMSNADSATQVDTNSRAMMPAIETAAKGEVTLRRGQSFFRAAVTAAYDCKCCVTGITTMELLRASHIVPWSQDESLRLNPRNGLCLNALHDAAFDRGLITFSDALHLEVSPRLKDEIPVSLFDEMFERHRQQPIASPERFSPTSEILAYHRTKIFQSN